MTGLRNMVTMLAATGALALYCQQAYCQQVSAQAKDAEPSTRAANEAFATSLPFSDRADFDDAKRGFIATVPDGGVAGPRGPAFDTKPYAFLQRTRCRRPSIPACGGRRSS